MGPTQGPEDELWESCLQNKRETSPFPGTFLSIWSLGRADWALTITNFTLWHSLTGVRHPFFQRTREFMDSQVILNCYTVCYY